ncbi:MAG: response regulator [candidate division Zixibacteria bacterium]|nr:response regulator [candidate division Zixibacteria bacterium]
MAASKERKILVVEDNPNMSSLLADMLEVFAVQSVRATDGEDALRKLGEESIGLVISDLRMPKMNGTELLSAIKDKDPNMPVVLISGYSLASIDDKNATARADGFLTKPFKMNDIKGILDRLYQR